MGYGFAYVSYDLYIFNSSQAHSSIAFDDPATMVLRRLSKSFKPSKGTWRLIRW